MSRPLFHCSVRQLRRTDPTKSGRRTSAKAAYDYIQRRGDYTSKKLARARKKHEKEERLVDWGGVHIPKWGLDPRNDATPFWKTCDEYERANARLAVKIEVAVPRDLPRQKLRELIATFCKKQFDKHPVSFAVHEGLASDGGPNLHIHYMACERKLDGIERPPELFFRQARPKNPTLGGAPRDRRWNSKNFLHEVRRNWADACNETLASAGIETRIDHRSNLARGIYEIPGAHDGPARLAMRARGVQVRERPGEKRRRNQRNELADIDAQISNLQKERTMINEPQTVEDPRKRDIQATVRRAKISLDNRGPQSRPAPARVLLNSQRRVFDERAFKKYAQSWMEQAGYTVHWLITVQGTPRAELDLPPFRAVHPGGHEVWSEGAGLRSSHDDQKSLQLMVDLAVLAGMKRVHLAGSEDAIMRLTVLCRERGIEVLNPPRAEDATVQPPAPPSPYNATKNNDRPQPMPKRERDAIARDIDSRRFPNALDTELAGQDDNGAIETIPNRHPLHMIRDAAKYDKVWFRSAKGDSRESIDRTVFYLLTERGFKPSQLRTTIARYQRENTTELKCSKGLARALEEFFNKTGEIPPLEIQNYIREGLGLLPLPTPGPASGSRNNQDPNLNGPG